MSCDPYNKEALQQGNFTSDGLPIAKFRATGSTTTKPIEDDSSSDSSDSDREESPSPAKQPVSKSDTKQKRTPYEDRNSGPMSPIASRGASRQSDLIRALKSIDRNLIPEDDNTFKKTFDLQWAGSSLMSDTVHYSEEDLIRLFKTYTKNPDKALEIEGYYEQPGLGDLFIAEVKVIKTSSNCGFPVGVVCKTEELSYWNDTPVCLATGKGESGVYGKAKRLDVMVTVPTGVATYADEGIRIVDNCKQLDTKAFASFGHLGMERILKGVIEPSEDDISNGDPRIKYAADTQIGRMILKEDNKRDLELKFKQATMRGEYKQEEKEGQIDVDSEGYIRIGPNTFAEAISTFEKKVRPLVRGKHDLRENGLTFGLVKTVEASSAVQPGPNHVVTVTLQAKYAYTKGSNDVREKKVAVVKLNQKDALINAVQRKLSTQHKKPQGRPGLKK